MPASLSSSSSMWVSGKPLSGLVGNLYNLVIQMFVLSTGMSTTFATKIYQMRSNHSSFVNPVLNLCLDHVNTNVPEKCNIPEVFTSGSSDHMPVMVTNFS